MQKNTYTIIPLIGPCKQIKVISVVSNQHNGCLWGGRGRGWLHVCMLILQIAAKRGSLGKLWPKCFYFKKNKSQNTIVKCSNQEV